MNDAVSSAEIGAAIERLVDSRADGATVCPSEVARALCGDDGRWRELMPAVRQEAARLARAGRLEVTRRGRVVEATAPGGPLRLGRPPPPRAGGGDG